MSKQKINILQKNKLLDLLASKPQLRAGKFSATFSYKDARNEWEGISQILNSIPGARKDWKSWRKTWQDILSKTKAKSAQINKIRRGTGGGPPPPDSLDDFEQGVAAFLHPHAISGHTESVESTVNFDDTVYVVEISDDAVPQTEVQVPQREGSDEVSQRDSDEVPAPSQRPPPQTSKQKQKKTNLKSLLNEKVRIKKDLLNEKKNFYEAYISNMERQTRALEDIGRALKNNENNNNT